MTLKRDLLQKISNPELSPNERARLRCVLAKRLEDVGDFEGAREALDGLWSRVGERPTLEGLDPSVKAELLLRSGVLTGWIGSAKQIANAQEYAKNLISEGTAVFDSLRSVEKVTEAQTELAYCYWRQGAFGEARILLREALARLAGQRNELRAIASLRLGLVEKVAGRLHDALHLHTEAVPLFEASDNYTLKGRFHNEFGTVLENLARAEDRADYIDRAFVEYTAASYYFEKAGHKRYQACVENNLGFLFGTTGKYDEAHEHLDRARALLTGLKDKVHLAQVDETRARVFLAEGHAAQAERLARAAVQALELGGESSLLSEALRTQGVALARMAQREQAGATLRRAWEVAEQAGDLAGAGQAALTLVEELGEELGQLELAETFERADELLAESRHHANKERLLGCARRALSLMGTRRGPERWRGFSFEEAVRRFEARLIERALRDAGGVVARAARLLGIKRQSLSSMLHTRHRGLLSRRPPAGPRRLTLRAGAGAAGRPPALLHVEDRDEVADAVRGTLEAEGWLVDVVGSGSEAFERLRGEALYDVLIFDYGLPGLDGLELTRRVRALPHRQRTPIIMLTAGEVEREARRAGVEAFLRKPQDVGSLVETVARLLARQQKRPPERDECEG